MPARITNLGAFLVGYANIAHLPPESRGISFTPTDGNAFELPDKTAMEDVVRAWLAWSKSAEKSAPRGVVTRSLAALADFVLFVETARRRKEKRLDAKMGLFIRVMERRGKETAS